MVESDSKRLNGLMVESDSKRLNELNGIRISTDTSVSN